MKKLKCFLVVLLFLLLLLFICAVSLSSQQSQNANPKQERTQHFLDIGIGGVTKLNSLFSAPIYGEEESINQGFLVLRNGFRRGNLGFGWKFEGNPFNSYWLFEADAGYWPVKGLCLSVGAGGLVREIQYADYYYYEQNYQFGFFGSLNMDVKLTSLHLKPFAPEGWNEIWVSSGVRSGLRFQPSFFVGVVFRFTSLSLFED